MTIKQFIEKAWEGGYKPSTTLEDVNKHFVYLRFKSDVCAQPITSWMIERVFLDPLAWKAVGKMEGWSKVPPCLECEGKNAPNDGYLFRMHCMIDALVEGQTIEQYLETL